MSDRLFERAVLDWLEDGSDATSPAAVDAVLLAIKTTPQQRALRIPWRFQAVPTYLRLVAALAIFAVVGVAGLTYFGNLGVGRSGPAPSCTSAPSPQLTPKPGATPLDRATWQTYTSTRFGFSICYPAGWVLRTGDMAPDPSHPAYAGLDPNQIHVVAGDETIFLSAWSASVASGTTLDSIVEATCTGYQITCPNWQAQATPVTVDGHPAYVALLGSCTNPACDTGWTEGYLLVDNVIYRVTSGRAPGEFNSDALVRTVFSTMHLLPAGPAPAASVAKG